MSIVETFEKMNKKNYHKNMVGDTIIYGCMIGIVQENNNDKFPGMVRVKIETRDKNKNILQWMKVASPYMGESYGIYLIPEIGDQVIVVCVGGCIDNAYIIGSVAKKNSKIVSKSFTDGNYKKIFVSKGNNQLSFHDEEDKQYIEISINNGQTIRLDSEKQTIVMKDKDSKNKIEIDIKNGTVSFIAEQKCIIKAGGAEMVMSKDGITMKGNNVAVNAEKNANVKCENLDVHGTNTTTNSTNSSNITSSGTVQVKAATVKLG